MSSHWPDDFLPVSSCLKDVLISSGSLLPGACIQILGSTGRSCNQAFFTKAHLESELEHQGTGPRISRASVQFGRRCLYLWVRYNMGHALKTWVYSQHSQKGSEKGVCNQYLFWKQNTTIATCWPEDFLSVSLCQKDVLISSGSLLPGASFKNLGSTGTSFNQAVLTKAQVIISKANQNTKLLARGFLEHLFSLEGGACIFRFVITWGMLKKLGYTANTLRKVVKRRL